MTRGPLTGAWVRRPLLARLLALLAAFSVFSQVSGALHWAVVEHVRCAEHGDWVHADDRHGADAPVTSASPSVSVVASDSEEHGHDHCQFFTDRRELTLAPIAFSVMSEPPVVGSSSSRASSEASAQPVIYELAPKTSPPV